MNTQLDAINNMPSDKAFEKNFQKTPGGHKVGKHHILQDS